MKFTVRALLSLIPFTLLVSSLGCNRKVGPPNDQDELMRPEKVASFDRLYKQNCSACHGENGSGGPALDLANPKYLALVDDASLKRWITSGMPGTQMPAFGQSAGGFLTPQQVDVLIAGMRERWDHKDNSAADIPPYSSSAAGSVEHGQDILRVSCSSCHQQGRQDHRRKLSGPCKRSEPADDRHRRAPRSWSPGLEQGSAWPALDGSGRERRRCVSSFAAKRYPRSAVSREKHQEVICE